MDFFSPIPISSETRARAFLWLCYHYYEAPSQNPFDDEYSRGHHGIIPTLEPLSAEEALLENLDTPEEKEWGEKMTAQRRLFMETKDKMLPPGEHSNDSQEPESSTSASKQKGSRAGRGGGQGRGRGGRRQKGRGAALTADTRLSRQTSLSTGDDISLQSATLDHNIGQDTNEGSSVPLPQENLHMTLSFQSGPSWFSRHHGGYSRPLSISPNPSHRLPTVRPPHPSPPPFGSQPEQVIYHDRRQHRRQSSSASIEPYPRQRPTGEHLHSETSDGKPIRHKRRGSARSDLLSRPSLPSLHQLDSIAERTLSRELPPLAVPSSPPPQQTESQSRSGYFSQHRRLPSVLSLNTSSTFSFPRPRTMLERMCIFYLSCSVADNRRSIAEAWHVATTTDPLQDSDDEADENTRLDLRGCFHM